MNEAFQRPSTLAEPTVAVAETTSEPMVDDHRAFYGELPSEDELASLDEETKMVLARSKVVKIISSFD